jgi:tryptophanyl-tRNA synthetase
LASRERDELKDHYRRGGLGDTAVKRRLEDVLQSQLAAVRDRFAPDMGYVLDVLRTGSLVAPEKGQITLDEVKRALGVFVLGPLVSIAIREGHPKKARLG